MNIQVMAMLAHRIVVSGQAFVPVDSVTSSYTVVPAYGVVSDPAVLRRSLIFVVSLIVLLVAHQVGDHVLQTDHQAIAKAGAGWPAARAMAGHVGTYHALAAVLLLTAFGLLGLPLDIGPMAAGLAFSAITHGLLDRRWPVRAVLHATRSAKFAEATTPVCGMYTADQALHCLALMFSALLIACS